MTRTNETLGLPDVPGSLKWVVIGPDLDQPTLQLVQKAIPDVEDRGEKILGSRVLHSKVREDIAAMADAILDDQEFASFQPGVLGDHYGPGDKVSPLILAKTIPHPPEGLFWRFKKTPGNTYALTFQLRKPRLLGSKLVAEQSLGTTTLGNLGSGARDLLDRVESSDPAVRVQDALRDLS